ncbi:MAG: hypothetical protein IK131_06725 [Paludibacteraceae bacterium]|nr:hypothetical protein [Paludibacteraceae bacterium]
MKTINILLIISCLCCVSAKSQNKQEFTRFINSLPTIEYGQLPYWHGITKYEIDNVNTECLVHGFQYKDTINNRYNYMLRNALNDSSYVLVGKKRTKIEPDNIFFHNENNVSTSYYRTETSTSSYEDAFVPSLYASAKSIFNNKYYVVYFWRAVVTQNIYYYAITFDHEGNIISYQHLDYYVMTCPLFPFNSEKNMKRLVDYSKSEVAYLPNKLILAKDIAVTEGGGTYKLSVLNKYGHYEVLKSWDEIGNFNKVPTGKYMNYMFEGENSKARVKIPFVVHDKDGFSNIREKADSKSAIVRTINDGDMVWGKYLANGWIKIDFTADKDGKIIEGGYIHSSRLECLYDEENEFVKTQSLEDWRKRVK